MSAEILGINPFNMKKSLILFRHAHAEWESTQGSDHERILSTRGEQEAKMVGLHLKQQYKLPQKIVCSSAVRAQSTINIANKAGDWNCQIDTDKTLYNTDAQYILSYIQQLSDSIDRIMLVGHEPTWSEISNQLIADRNTRLVFSTAMLMNISFDLDAWSDVHPLSGELQWILDPNA